MFFQAKIYQTLALCGAAATFCCAAPPLPYAAAAESAQPISAETANAGAGKALFQRRCAACHYADADKNKIGPSLYRIYGRKAGQNSHYRYSAAMKTAGQDGLIWTKENLEQFLRAPQKRVPGTRMPPLLPHLSAADTKDIIRYLSQDKP